MSAAAPLLIAAYVTLAFYREIDRRYPASHWPSLVAGLSIALALAGGGAAMVEGVR